GTASYTAATTTTVASSGSPSLFGHPVTFTATVTAGAPAANPPAGTVTFYLCASPASLAPGSPAPSCATPVALGPAVALGASGQLSASGAAALRLCGATISGSVSVSGTTGLVLAGDGGDDGQPACAGNTLKGSVSLSGNSGGIEAGGNKVSGSVSVTGNPGTG